MEFTTCLGLHVQATRLLRSVLPTRRPSGHTGLSPSVVKVATFQLDLGAIRHGQGWTDPARHISTPARYKGRRIRRWAHPFSVALTKGIPVGFFSST